MADITSSVMVDGANFNNDRPFNRHTWTVTIPAAALAGAGPDDITLPDRFGNGSFLFDIRAQVIVAATAATSLVMDIEQVLIADVGGAESGTGNLFSGVDLETIETTSNTPSATKISNFITFGDAVDDTNKRAIRLELTKVGAISGADCVVEVQALIVRNVY
jgi:hypothetical protein